ncbi:MAG: glycosyltransferase [Candidatus Delongbacteria bacterium]|nr:glycosyltransferase [Candidatus Delongbacteria bacterium]
MEAKIKILHIIESLATGGKERRLVELVKNTKKDEPIDYIIVLLSDKIDFNVVYELGIEIITIKKEKMGSFKLLLKLNSIISEYKPDIIHSWAGDASVYVSILKIFNKFKFINGMITSAPNRVGILSKNWIFSKFSFQFSNIILGNSKAGLKSFKAPSRKSRCIYNGFDFKRLENLKDKEYVKNSLKIKTKYTICMVAAFSIFKDYRTYIKAAQIVLNNINDVTFLCIGAGNKESFRSMIEPDNVNKILIMDRRENIEEIINVCDIGVLATYSEGISNSVLEYMALGKPAIASGSGGLKEIIDSGKSGYVLNEGDHIGMANKISELISDPAKMSSFGNESRKTIERNFSITSMVNSMISLYKEV